MVRINIALIGFLIILLSACSTAPPRAPKPSVIKMPSADMGVHGNEDDEEKDDDSQQGTH